MGNFPSFRVRTGESLPLQHAWVGQRQTERTSVLFCQIAINIWREGSSSRGRKMANRLISGMGLPNSIANIFAARNIKTAKVGLPSLNLYSCETIVTILAVLKHRNYCKF